MQRIVLDNLHQLKMACAELVKLANERGGEDNITLIIAKLTGSDLPEPSDEAVRVQQLDFGIHDTAEQDTGEILQWKTKSEEVLKTFHSSLLVFHYIYFLHSGSFLESSVFWT